MRRVKHSARTVIVTGASAGVGRAIAHRFAREGDRAGLIARDEAASIAGLFWIVFMFAMTFSDYLLQS